MILLLTPEVKGQRVHAVYGELLGAGLIYSVNYDLRFQERGDGIGARLGFSFFSRDGNSNTSIPLQLNYLIGKGQHKLEVGAGISTFFQKDSGENEAYVFPSGVFMYRLQLSDSPFLFRIGFSPIFAPEEEGAIITSKVFWFWPGLSLGAYF